MDKVSDDLNPEAAFATRMPDASAYGAWSSGMPLYAPWLNPSTICEDVEDVMLLSVNDPARLYYLAAFCRQAAHLKGAFAECGVFRGGTGLLMARASAAANAEIHLIDSFSGLSNPDSEQDIYYQAGDFCFSDLASVEGVLFEAGERVRIHKGWIPEVFETLPARDWALVHVDLDLFAPTLASCAYFYPRLMRGGVMVFDEYGYPTCRGERDAIDTFFADKSECPIVLPTGQAFVIKL